MRFGFSMPIKNLYPQFSQVFNRIKIDSLNQLVAMKKQEQDILQDISRIEENQTLLFEKPTTPQQEFLRILGQRYLLDTRKMLHKNLEETLNYLRGTFCHQSLTIKFITLCIASKIQLDSERFPFLKLLIDWAQIYTELRSQKSFKLTQAIFQKGKLKLDLKTMEEYIVYINFIAYDLRRLIRRPSKNSSDETLNLSMSSARDLPGTFTQNHTSPTQILEFLNFSLPKTLINIILPPEVLPSNLKKLKANIQCLYANRSLQYFAKNQQTYASFIRLLIKMALKFQYKVKEQAILMDLVFRYFYCYHHDKKWNAHQIFIETYNTISEQARESLAQDFILFFRIATRIGKGKFVEFIISKSEWLKQITQNVTQRSMVGYKKQDVLPFNPVGLHENIVVQRGKIFTKTFQILEDYSLFYFKILVTSHDVNIRLFYLGPINANKPTKDLLVDLQKVEGSYENNVMAIKRGLYCFEFDNSYSWINSKLIKFDNVILTPLQIQSENKDQWISSIYGGISMNAITKKEDIYFVNIPEKRKEIPTKVANVTRQGEYLWLKITSPNHVYEFESESPEGLLNKIDSITKTTKDLLWQIEGNEVSDFESIRKYANQLNWKHQQKISPTVKEAPPPPKKEIIQSYYEQEEVENDGRQIQSKLQTSINQSQPPAQMDQSQYSLNRNTQ